MTDRLIRSIRYMNGNVMELRKIGSAYYCVLIKKDGTTQKQRAMSIPYFKGYVKKGYTIEDAFFNCEVEEVSNPVVFDKNDKPCGRVR